MLRKHFGCLLGRRPVEPTDQVLAVFPAGKPTGTLLLCFMMECLLNGGPVILQIDVGFGHEGRFTTVPMVEIVSGPAPFVEVGQGGCHWPFHMVPLMLLFVKLVAYGDPCLLDVLDMVSGPIGDQGVQSPDVVKDHLISWISKLVADLIIDDILEASLMQSQVLVGVQACILELILGLQSPRRRLAGLLCSRRRVRRLGNLRLRSLIRRCLFLRKRCWRVVILRRWLAEWSMPRSLMTVWIGGSCGPSSEFDQHGCACR